MTRFVALAVAAICATGVHADGVGDSYARPALIEPAETWTGAYIGVGITTRTKSTTTVTQEHDGFLRECRSLKSTHNGQKCVVSEHDYNNSPEITGLREVSNPWNKGGLKFDGQPGEIVRYTSGYYGVWLNDNTTFQFTSDSDSAAPTAGKQTTNTTIDDVFTDIFSLGEDEEITGAAFGRYLHDFGSFVGGGEAGYNGSDAYAEAQLGLDAGQIMPWVGFGSEGASLGVDFRANDRIVFGAKATEEGRAELRIMWGL